MLLIVLFSLRERSLRFQVDHVYMATWFITGCVQQQTTNATVSQPVLRNRLTVSS